MKRNRRRRSRRPPRPRRPAHTFYSGDPTSSPSTPQPQPALDNDGQAGQISVLLARLAEASDARPGDVRLLLQSADTLSRIATSGRLSGASRKSLAERMAAVLNSFGDQWLPEERRVDDR